MNIIFLIQIHYVFQVDIELEQINCVHKSNLCLKHHLMSKQIFIELKRLYLLIFKV